MGSRDSSKTRVVQVFQRLFDTDPTGALWLTKVLSLGNRPEVVARIPNSLRLVSGHGPRWGRQEVRLRAPLPLLEHLVRTVTNDRVAASKSRGLTRSKRELLARQDVDTVAEAIRRIRAGEGGRQWFVLEGESRPDAFLETAEIVVCVEGKRTEATCTTSTVWMGTRSQLLRHMDAAAEAYPDKRVYGLLIVEGDGGAEAVAPSKHWVAQCSAQYGAEMADASLPHRSPEQRRRICDGVLGVTTWQAVCAATEVPWESLPDKV